MNLRLKNKVIIVTGGAKGIGMGIAKSLAQEGAIPVIVGRNPADNQKVITELRAAGFYAHQITAELNVPSNCSEVVKEAVSINGRIDGLVNNAGLNDGVGLENGSCEKFLESLHHSLIHYYAMAHCVLPELKKTKGSILNITSKTSETGQGNTSGYAASNGGRNALTREWAVELLKYEIRVNAISVAECWTPQYASWIKTLPDGNKTVDEIKSRIPFQNRMTTTEEIAAMALFLLSVQSSHTTGQIIHVDGGYVHLDRALVNEI